MSVVSAAVAVCNVQCTVCKKLLLLLVMLTVVLLLMLRMRCAM